MAEVMTAATHRHLSGPHATIIGVNDTTTDTTVPETTAALAEYDTLVAQYCDSMDVGANKLQWYPILDLRPDARPVTRHRRFRKPVTIPAQVYVTGPLYNAYLLLLNRQQTLQRLNLPESSPLPGQLDAALRRLCDLAAAISLRCDIANRAIRVPEHDQAVLVAAQAAALVDLAERRESVVEYADPDSMRRTAQALLDDLNAARTFLSTDPLDRQLNAATH